MTVRELIVALTKVDPDSIAGIYSDEEATGDDWKPIIGVDPYESTSILVVDHDVIGGRG